MSPTPVRLFGVSLVALLALPVLLGSIRTSSQVIVTESDVVDEDLYSLGGRTIVEGVVRGDLVVFTGELIVSGTVEGDIVGAVGGSARISGTVGGSVRIAAIDVELTGSVGDDAALAFVESEVAAEVGRDLLALGGELAIAGAVGRDLRAQVLSMRLDGAVGRDVRARVDSMSLGGGATVHGDVLYKARRSAEVASGAVVSGQFTRQTVLAPVWAKAVTRLFAILSLLAFVVAGLALVWLFRGTSQQAVRLAGDRPGRAALVGGAVVVVPPLMVAPLFLTLVGLPIALFILLAWVAALFLGPYPAVARLGTELLRGRADIAAALVVGAVVWRAAMWLLPLVAALLYLAALLIGSGAFTMAAWEQRRSRAA